MELDVTPSTLSDADLSTLAEAWPLTRLVEFYKTDSDRQAIDEIGEDAIAQLVARVNRLLPMVMARTDRMLDPSTMPDVRDLQCLGGMVVAWSLLRAGQRFWSRLSAGEQAQAIAHAPAFGLEPRAESVLRGIVGAFHYGVTVDLTQISSEQPMISELLPYSVPLYAFQESLERVTNSLAFASGIKKGAGIRGHGWFRH